MESPVLLTAMHRSYVVKMLKLPNISFWVNTLSTVMFYSAELGTIMSAGTIPCITMHTEYDTANVSE